MKFIEAMKIKRRLCDYVRAINNGYKCTGCVLSSSRNGTELLCHNFLHEYPDKAEKILEQWNKEHPAKTFKDDFFEKFPNAPKEPTGEPRACLKNLGFVDECPRVAEGCKVSCLECWNQPIEE